MGQVNQPADLISQVAQLRQDMDTLRRMVGLSSATITKGGLTIKGGAFFEMDDAAGNLVVYIGPDGTGAQIFQLWHPGGGTILATQKDVASGRYFTAIRDYLGHIIFADDVQTGGMAFPYLAVPLYPMFTTNVAAGSVVGYNTFNASAITSETTLWEGRIPLGSHPRISIDGVWGQGSGANNTTFRLYVAGTAVGSWIENGTLEVARKGPYDISSTFGSESIQVQLRAVSSGTGVVAAQVFGCYLRQT